MEVVRAVPEARPADSVSRLTTWRFRCTRYWPYVAMAAVVLFFGVVRFRLRNTPLERDEGEYAYAGQLMLQGIPPYKFAYNMKLPGTYAAYGLMMAALGETPAGIHLGLLLVNTLTIILTYLLAGKLFDRSTGMIAAATYALLSTHQSTMGFAAHATHFVVICAIAGLILLLHAEERDSVSLSFWSGVMFGLTFLMKQPGIFFGVFAFAYLVFETWHRRTAWRRLALQCATFTFGCVIPFVITCAVLWRAGVFANFWFWTFSYARQYSELTSLKDGWELFTHHFVPMWSAVPGIWTIALVGLSALIWYLPARRYWFFVLGLLVFSFVGVSSGLYFRSHYFVMVLPAVALLTGIGVTALGSFRPSKPMLRVAACIVFAVAFGWSIIKNTSIYFRDTPDQVCQVVYPNSPFVDAISVSQYIQQHTEPTDRIITLGSEPEVYFYSHRISASGYIYVYPLMEDQPYWRKMQQQMIQEIESSRPAYLLYITSPSSWLAEPTQLNSFLSWAKGFVQSQYELEGRVELNRAGSHYYWGEQAKAPPQTTGYISIFKRKDYIPKQP